MGRTRSASRGDLYPPWLATGSPPGAPGLGHRTPETGDYDHGPQDLRLDPLYGIPECCGIGAKRVHLIGTHLQDEIPIRPENRTRLPDEPTVEPQPIVVLPTDRLPDEP